MCRSSRIYMRKVETVLKFLKTFQVFGEKIHGCCIELELDI